MKYFFKYLAIGIFLFYPLVSFSACPLDKPIQTLSGCMPCDDPNALLQLKCITCDDESDVDILAVCPNRQRKGITTILKECPIDKPHRASTGACYACSDEREFYVEKDYKNPCENRMIYQQGESYVSGIICPSDKPIYSFGKCYACDERQSLKLDKDIYQKFCPNRVMRNEYFSLNQTSNSEVNKTDTDILNKILLIVGIMIYLIFYAYSIYYVLRKK